MGTLARQTSEERRRVFVLRRPVKSVRQSEHPDPLPVRLAIGVVAVGGTVAAIWLLGALGYQLGFAPRMHVPEMTAGVLGSLAAGATMFAAMPGSLLRTALAQPVWLLLCFALIAIPAGAFASVKPITPGGPKPHVLVIVFSILGAVMAIVNAGIVVVWLNSPLRMGLIGDMPLDAAAVTGWLADLRLAAGIDVLAAIAAGLWVVLIMRLAIPGWLRGLAATASFATMLIVAVSAATTSVTIAQVTSGRSMAVDHHGAERLVIGRASSQFVMLSGEGGLLRVELRKAGDVSVRGRESIEGFAMGRRARAE
jgi:hypothetical protein